MEVPRTFDQLVHTMKGFLGLTFCSVMLLGVWEKHYRFFRRFGLQDGWTMILNGLVLFVVVFTSIRSRAIARPDRRKQRA